MIYKHRMLSIVIAAFFTTAALTALVSLNWLMLESKKSITVMEQNGFYDLTNISNLGETVVKLAPGATYYPGTYLIPKSVNTAVPESSQVYSMTFKLSGRHAMKVFVNGNLAAQNGQPGVSKKDTEVWENNITFHGVAVNGKIDIILNSGNQDTSSCHVSHCKW